MQVLPISGAAQVPPRATSGLARALGFCDVDARSVTRLDVRRIDPGAYAGMAHQFNDLAARAAHANPFMSPAAVLASSRHMAPADIVILSARDLDDEARLLGVWVLRLRRDVWSLGMRVLQAPLLPLYECLASPMLDRDHAAEALQALLEHVRACPDLPKAIRVTSWPLALAAILPAGFSCQPAERWERAVLDPAGMPDADTYLKASMGKALNKRSNKLKELAAAGSLVIASARGADAPHAFEQFVALEAAGWKGASGTALASRPGDLAYMRAAISGLASADRVSVDSIVLDGKPLAIGVVIEAGSQSLFWKSAFDEAHARHAPGALLHLAVTRRLFAEGRPRLDSGMMEFTSPAFLPWAERAEMARVTIDCGEGIAGRLAAVSLRTGAFARHGLRRLERAVQAMLAHRKA